MQYRSTHHDTILGVPTVYGCDTGALGGFLSCGQAYALIQYDMRRQALLLLYSIMAHQSQTPSNVRKTLCCERWRHGRFVHTQGLVWLRAQREDQAPAILDVLMADP